MIYVTHDQIEAMTLADRIVVLNQGKIEQIGTPMQLYNAPVNEFVAGFIGAPAMNFTKATVHSGYLTLGNGNKLDLSRRASPKSGNFEGREVVVGIRPEHFCVAQEGVPTLKARVQVVEPLGSDTLVHFTLGNDVFTARLPPQMRPVPNSEIHLGFNPEKIHLFDVTSERALH